MNKLHLAFLQIKGLQIYGGYNTYEVKIYKFQVMQEMYYIYVIYLRYKHRIRLHMQYATSSSSSWFCFL
jgi:hypothetical protein